MVIMTDGRRDMEERKVPGDIVLKPLCLFAHFVGFSIVFGAFHEGHEPRLAYSALTVASGLLLIVRELYQEGLVWCVKTEGVLTAVKLLVLLGAVAAGSAQDYWLMVVLLLGVLTSHVPKPVKRIVWFPWLVSR
jgi:hypothetical protein